MSDTPPDGSRKRRRVGERRQRLQPEDLLCDIDQDVGERRGARRDLRNLFSKLFDSRAEYLRAESRGLEETLQAADKIYQTIKQTSDATIDSRLLVETADLSARKINNLILGDATTAIDVDDFVTKCIAFMKQGNDLTTAGTQTQTQRGRRGQQADGEGEDDALNWDYLGKNACFLYNSRPCLTGFLLGPLSVQKKVRRPAQRRAREARTGTTQAVRPARLDDEDPDKKESATLTEICTEIARILRRAQATGIENAEREFDEAPENLSDAERRVILRRNVIASNGGVPLVNFCVNPKSFAQTVENFFYVSFLVKEGRVGLESDNDGFPTLSLVPHKSLEERQVAKRNQVIFVLNIKIWEDLVETFGIQESIIPHRMETESDDGRRDESEDYRVEIGEGEQDSPDVPPP